MNDKTNNRPSMQEDDHPAHRMPSPQHDGFLLNDVERGMPASILSKRNRDHNGSAVSSGGE